MKKRMRQDDDDDDGDDGNAIKATINRFISKRMIKR